MGTEDNVSLYLAIDKPTLSTTERSPRNGFKQEIITLIIRREMK
jgi:hypothetical protein